MNYRLLKKTRVGISLLFFVFTALLFADLYEKIPTSFFNKVVYLQLIPSLLNFLKIAGWTSFGFIIVGLISLLFGRIYCSTICPIGIFQDIIAFIAKKRSSSKMFYKKKKGFPVLRYLILGITILALLFSFQLIISILDPYSNAARFFTYFMRPVIIGVNNLAALILNKAEIYTLSPVKYMASNWLSFVFTFFVFGAITYMSYKRGRLFCNTICPVGSLLGLLSKVSWFKISFDANKCTRCAKCVSVCKSECIDIKNYSIDHSRCVDCYNCLAVCADSALSYSPPKHKKQKVNQVKSDNTRRNFFATGLALCVGQSVFSEIKNGKVVDTSKLIKNTKDFPVAPPGSVAISRFNNTCTACGLCIAACPTQVLQPAIRQYGLNGFLQPHMDYISGYCNFDCNKCSEVCPTGAIAPISIEEKHLTQLGKAIFVKENCVVYTDGTDCGACSEHCPTKAVNMVPYQGKLLIPEVNQDICIGCGACEHPCPVEAPYKAIYVNGNAVHQAAQKPKEEESELKEVEEDFPF